MLLNLFTLLVASKSFAVCSSPAGVAGQFQFMINTMQVCDGNAWSEMDTGVVGSTCSTSGVIQKNGSDFQVCTGVNWISLSGTQTNGTCSVEGLFQYNSTQGWMQWCDGANWRAMQKAPAASATGYIQKTEQGNTPTAATNIVTPAFVSSTASGNAIVCKFYWSGAANITGVTDSAGNTYTKAAGLADGTDKLEMWYRENIVGGSSVVVTAALSASTGGYKDRSCMEYSGFVTSNALDQVAPLLATTATANPTVTTTSAKSVLIQISVLDNTATMDGTYTTRSTLNGNPTIDKRVNTKGSYTSSVSGLTNTNFIIFAGFRAR